MSHQAAPIGRFLRARRDALPPEAVGLVRDPGRRVPGLRREEVAARAGISPEYYLRLEQGRDHQPSHQVLSTLARALLLSETEEQYLLRLVLPLPLQQRARDEATAVDPDLLATMDSLRGTPVVLLSPNKDVVAVNAAARAVPHDGWRRGSNLLLHAFSPEVKHTWPGWAAHARELVAALRLTANLRDPRLHEVVGTLSVRDGDFPRWWAAHELPARASGRVTCSLRGSGAVDLHWQDLMVAHRAGYALRIFHAAAGTAAEAVLRELLAGAGSRPHEGVPRQRVRS